MNCRFSEKNDFNEVYERYECHKLPPVIVENVSDMCSFPMVHSDDWCGEFRFKSDDGDVIIPKYDL